MPSPGASNPTRSLAPLLPHQAHPLAPSRPRRPRRGRPRRAPPAPRNAPPATRPPARNASASLLLYAASPISCMLHRRCCSTAPLIEWAAQARALACRRLSPVGVVRWLPQARHRHRLLTATQHTHGPAAAWPRRPRECRYMLNRDHAPVQPPNACETPPCARV